MVQYKLSCSLVLHAVHHLLEQATRRFEQNGTKRFRIMEVVAIFTCEEKAIYNWLLNRAQCTVVGMHSF